MIIRYPKYDIMMDVIIGKGIPMYKQSKISGCARLMAKVACHTVYRVFSRVTRSHKSFIRLYGRRRDRNEGQVTEKKGLMDEMINEL